MGGKGQQSWAMNTLATDFDGIGPQKGYRFHVMKRQGPIVLLEKHNPAHKSGQRFYEVVIVQVSPNRRFPDGRVVEEHEAMPSPEQWGIAGWSPFDLQAAEQRFNQLVKAHQDSPQ